MKASISQLVYDAGQKLASSSGNLADELNETLNQLLKWPYRATKGFVRSAEGQKTGDFGSLVYTASQSLQATTSLEVFADKVACVIDVNESLDAETLESAYERIASAKRLKKVAIQDEPNVPITTVTLGIIFSRSAKVPLDVLAEKLDQLNRQHPDREWTNMVAVLSEGIVNYVVQPAGECVGGDFLPASEHAFERFFPPPWYIIIFIRPTGQFTFNKMFAYLLGHLMFFSPGADLPDLSHVLECTPDKGITYTGYQYNLSGKLVPLSPYFIESFYPPQPFLIEDHQGKSLGTLQFLSWQDGGVLLLKGRLPLDSLMVFLGKKVLEKGFKINVADGQISNLLPITKTDFIQLIQRIQQQSNFVMKQNATKYVVQKIADEGSSSPFWARLFLGPMRLRDSVFSNSNSRIMFDKSYQLVLEPLLNTRSASMDIIQLIADHSNSLKMGEVAQLQGNSIKILKPIDKDLRKDVEYFLNSAARVLKQGMQEVAKTLGFNIGFFFKKQSTFEEGIKLLKKDDPYLASYLLEARKWSDQLIRGRVALEHEGWILPKVKYREVAGVIYADEPEILDYKVTEFVNIMLDRLFCFVEEITMHCLIKGIPTGTAVTEIPLPLRDPTMPLRFKVTLANGGLPVWHIIYHNSSFEET